MSFIAWDSTYDVGVPVIDSQHRRIVDYINQLYESVASGDRAAVADVLEQLSDYIVAHFGFEEAMQEQGGYPRLDEHRKSHQKFAAKIKHYQEQHENGGNVSGKLLSELQIWLLTHIQQEDTDYVPYVKKNVGKSKISAFLSKFFD